MRKAARWGTMAGYDRAVVRNHILRQEFDAALDYMRQIEAGSSLYSPANSYAKVDRYALLAFQKLTDPELAALFDARFIARRTLREAAGLNPDSLNTRLMDMFLRVGIADNAPPRAGLQSDEVGLISNHRLDHEEEPLKTLIEALQHIFDSYIEELRQSSFPQSLIPARMTTRSFVTASKRDGFHKPHLHTRCAFVLAYYVRVPPDSQATLEFGRHNMFQIEPFHRVVPAEGDIMMFPSCFMHGTTPARCQDLRANLGLEFEAAAK